MHIGITDWKQSTKDNKYAINKKNTIILMSISENILAKSLFLHNKICPFQY
jgi:hypothetical protein